MSRIERRQFLKGLGVGASSLLVPFGRLERLNAQAKVHEISINAAYARGQWFYSPAGLYIAKGETVRWTSEKFGATVTAFHPANSNHELRIPEKAKPFDSGLLGEDSPRYSTFEWTFDVEGTYDYFSRNHEPLGMVGRIVVGAPGGPAETHPPGYGGREGRAPMFDGQARLLAALPSSQIVKAKSVAYPRDVVFRKYPYSGGE